jgi:hypothetical protein
MRPNHEQQTQQQEPQQDTQQNGGDSTTQIPDRRGAIGKAIIVYLFSGSAVLAILAFVLFRGMGC